MQDHRLGHAYTFVRPADQPNVRRKIHNGERIFAVSGIDLSGTIRTRMPMMGS